MKIACWAAFAISLWLVLVLSTLPASWAVYIAQNTLPNWQVSDINGNFWQGNARNNQLFIDNKPFPLGELKWQLNPISFLWLTPCVKFTTHLRNQILSANACLSLIDGELHLYNGRLSINVAALDPWLAVRLEGSADMAMKSMVFKAGNFSEVEGIIKWRKAQFHNSRTWIDLGDLEVSLSNNGVGEMQGKLTNIEPGPLTTDLTIEIPKASGLSISGEVALNSKEQSTSNEALQHMLQIIGKPNKQGGYVIAWNNR